MLIILKRQSYETSNPKQKESVLFVLFTLVSRPSVASTLQILNKYFRMN